MAAAFILQAIFLVGLVTIGKTSGAMFTLALILVYFTWGEIYAFIPIHDRGLLRQQIRNCK
jgi:hypothetical protein